MQSRVTISGNIVSELSEKIPSNIIALNELIKNAYDAGAPSVEVSLDSTKKKLIIKDTGEGMNKAILIRCFIYQTVIKYMEVLIKNTIDMFRVLKD